MADKKPAKPPADRPETATLNLRIDKQLKKRVSHWCIDQDAEITELIVALLTDFLDHQPRAMPKPKK